MNSKRQKALSLVELAEQTLAIQDQGAYQAPSGRRVEIAGQQAKAVDRTRLYTPEDLIQLDGQAMATRAQTTQITVTEEKTQAAVRRLVQDEGIEDPVVLNFASARHVGGGFLKGARAQEEDLVRCSGLFRCLETQQSTYYAINRAESSLLYSDHMIYSPGVPWFRDEALTLLETPFLASVITAPAPNAGPHLQRHPGDQEAVRQTLRRRARYILRVAEAQRHSVLVLGAWGAGVFKNNPVDVAATFGELLEGPFAGHFRHVVFAVVDATKEQPRLLAFRARFQ
ncbi:TIGR02452 family protein [Lamprobacter modestohalophilus]|uniref:TIGR02452 family protein n=1 Tax=Lamprobacter modestohalophilus TaxID=1064514 RepID=UPI002ADEF1D5|nr:TIGR02452 family protein [Lamprobacter modestohalophilus]MEA1051273.1 TIGR02452 family protein [Lamprobacter modestohalophilus]